jgi:hypothetical protein
MAEVSAEMVERGARFDGMGGCRVPKRVGMEIVEPDSLASHSDEV